MVGVRESERVADGSAARPKASVLRIKCECTNTLAHMAFLRSFYVADDIWRFAWSLVGCLLALSWLPTPHTAPPGPGR